MSTLFQTKKISQIALAVILAFSFFMGVFGSVSADDGTTGPTPSPRKAITMQQMELRYTNLKLVVEKCMLLIEKSDNGFPKVQEFITRLKEKGIDTSVLEGKLSALTTAIKTNQGHIDQANNILAAHAGFDTNGKVIDVQQAHQTLQSARQEVKAYRDGIRDAAKAFRTLLKDMKEQFKNSKSS